MRIYSGTFSGSKTVITMVLVLASIHVYGQGQITRPPKKTDQTSVSSSPAKRSETTSQRQSSSAATTSSSSSSVSSASGSTNPAKRSETTSQRQSSSAATTSSSSSSVSSASGSINGHEWVDLGLSVKWATCNVGASSPSDYGGYYAWGETTAKSSYTEENSKTYGKNLSELRSAGIIGSSGNLTMQYDAARANWGGSWRLPTKAECQELVDKCTWKWTTQDGHKGYKVTGPNGKSIFLPAAGWRHGTSLNYAGEDGYFWSSAPLEGSSSGAYYLFFDSGYHGLGWYCRYDGRSVRPVSE